MWCPSCGFENPPGFKFCGACGTSLIGQTRATRELAVDLRLALRSVLRPLGEFGRILVFLREAEALAEALDDSRRLGQVSRFLTNHFRLMGAYDHAIAEQALVAAHEHQERGHQAYAVCLLGKIASHRERPDTVQAEAQYRQALALAEELGLRPLMAHCHRGLGTLNQQTRRSDQARTELATAITLYQAMEMTFWLPQAEAVLA